MPTTLPDRRAHALRRFAALAMALVAGLTLAPASVQAGVIPTPVAGQIAVGGNHWCTLQLDGRVKCAGTDIFGELGDGTPTNTPRQDFQYVVGVSRAVAVDAGGQFTCALLASGHIQCWGRNESRQLGDNSTVNQSAHPVTVWGIDDASQITVSGSYACALRADQTVWCWGENYGRLGVGGSDAYVPLPTQIPGLSSVLQVSAGGTHICAVLSGGSIKCWGNNFHGRLGNGSTTSSSSPVSVTGITNAFAVGAGQNHTCALLGTGTVSCWGDNDRNEVGQILNPPGYFTTPVAVAGISTAVAITSMGRTNCVLLTDATVRCWGYNDEGSIGDGTNQTKPTPTSPTGLSNVVEVDTFANNTCALLGDGTEKCWGAHAPGSSEWHDFVPFLVDVTQGSDGIANDAFAAPQAFSNVPYDDTVGATTLTAEASEPALSCNGGGAPAASVWYRYKPRFDHTLHVTAGANTVAEVFTGSTIGALTPLECVAPGASGQEDVDTDVTYVIRLAKLTATGSLAFQVAGDVTAPTDPTLGSSSHVPNVWSKNWAVFFTWSGASDAESGIGGYSFHWDHDADSVPDTVVETGLGGDTVTASLSSGSWYFHLRTRDKAGNWSDGVSEGPYLIDVDWPGKPTPTSSSHTVNLNSGDNTIDVSWPAVSDSGGSGTSGYSFLFDTIPVTNPDEVADPAGSSPHTTSTPLADLGRYWFHVRARDAAGNWGDPAHLGPFLIDMTPPDLPDSMLRLVADTPFVGSDVYNTNAASQIRATTVKRGKTRTFVIRIQNDGLVADKFRLKGPGTNSKFTVTYLKGTSGTTRITSAVVNGTYVTKSIARGGSISIRIVIKARPGAAIGSVLASNFVVVSNGSAPGTDTDVVRPQVTVVR